MGITWDEIRESELICVDRSNIFTFLIKEIFIPLLNPSRFKSDDVKKLFLFDSEIVKESNDKATDYGGPS